MSIASFVVNIVANVILIPPFGIVGAAAASLVSYSFSAVLATAIVARVTGARILDFWLPRPSDVQFVISTSLGPGAADPRRGRRRGVRSG